MRKLLPIILIVLATASCKKMIEPIRVQMPGTYWLYSVGDQTARVSFPDDEHASVIQWDVTSNAAQALHGTYSTDGHRVLLTGENWPNDIKFVRTFSHLKNNSSNKNLTPLSPLSYSNLAGSVWATMVHDNLNIVFFDHDGTCMDATFPNVNHKEGYPYGWQWNRKDYSLSGTQVMAGSGIKGTLYDSFMQVDTLSVMQVAPAPENPGTSALAGTVWTYDTAGYPGLIIFTSGSTFTRILTSSHIVFSFMNGTYTLSGTELNMNAGEIKETCQLSADRFTLFEKDFVKATLP